MPDNKAVVKTGNEKSISPAVIKRLPRYYRYLGDLLKNDVVRISSKELSQRMNVTASQIRQDLNNFGGFGQQGYGYNVEYLYNEMGKILGLDRTNNIVIVGAGNLGQALANNQDFDSNGFKIIGLFDVNPRLIGMTVRGVEVYDIDMLETFLKEHEVMIAALTLPKSKAVKVAEKLVDLGIKALWNFAPVDLHFSEDILVENVHLANNQDFDSNGFKIIGLFDVNPRLIGMTVRGVEVYDIDMLETFLKEHEVMIAALTLPKSKAVKVAEKLVDLGIKALWNFAPVDLHFSEDILVENVHLAESIMTLSYRIHSQNQ